MMASCNLMKAFPPSPYNSGICTLKIPIKQYAVSSSLDVILCDAHDIRFATLA
jgi:hypothetical protein